MPRVRVEFGDVETRAAVAVHIHDEFVGAGDRRAEGVPVAVAEEAEVARRDEGVGWAREFEEVEGPDAGFAAVDDDDGAFGEGGEEGADGVVGVQLAVFLRLRIVVVEF